MKHDVNISITSTPCSVSPIIDIKFDMIEIRIGKCKSSKKPVAERKEKHARNNNWQSKFLSLKLRVPGQAQVNEDHC